MSTIDAFFKPQKRSHTKADQIADKTLNKENEPSHTTLGNQDRLKALEKLENKIPGTEGMGISWKKALKDEFSKPYFIDITKFVSEERRNKTIYPTIDNVYSWSRACSIDQIKVVIIGQDPYHGPNQAHGLCFSVPVGVAVPPSLENIYKELSTDIPGFKHPGHGYLMGWAKQGVLLLNSCLTVEASRANSHQGKGWEKFTDSVISWIDSNLKSVVFLLWGSYAHKKCSFINKNKHLILKSVHPSPLSVYRGFFGCKHFSKANDYLVKHGIDRIDWTCLPRE